MKEKFKSWAFSKEHGKCDVITLIIYLLGVCTVSFFHEPWFDEAQSWAIARSGTIKEILFEIPHYEGHPPLWHLILAPFAKLGAPYELSLAAVNIFFMTLAVAVLLFKSPFPKLIRCLLPFNFFLFYQYGVVSRPYCILVLAVFLAAVTYKNKNERPLKYILSLALMCMIHSYGILIAGGLCIVWLIEIFSDKIKAGAFRQVFSDKRCWFMFGLLILALSIIVEIMPADDIYLSSSTASSKSVIASHWYLTPLFVLPIFSDTFLTSFFDDSKIGFATELSVELVVFIISAVVMVLFISILYKNKKLMTFVIPYAILNFFSLYTYFSIHHLGVYAVFLMFILWILVDTSDKIQLPKYFIDIYNNLRNSMKTVVTVIAFLPLIIPLSWSVVSSYNDIKSPYWVAEAADFIKENHLDNYNIMGFWAQNEKELKSGANGMVYDRADYEWYDYPNLQGFSVAINTYFDNNIFYNFNIDDHSKTFQYYKKNTQEEAKEQIKKWKAVGKPDVIVGRCEITKVFPDIDVNDYIAVKSVEFYKIYKYIKADQYLTIYVSKDLFNKIGTFEEIPARKLY